MPFNVTFSLDTPATNYNVRIETVLVVADELWVLSQVGTDADLGGCMISRRSATVSVIDDALAGLPQRHFVGGCRWNWHKGDECERVDLAQVVQKAAQAGATTVAIERE